MVLAELGSTKPQPSLPFWRAAATAEQTPRSWLLLAQQAVSQSASLVQPPVMNCWALARPTFLAPALLGVTTARAETATTHG